MVYTKVFWSGVCPLQNVCFANARISEFQISEISESIEKIWLEHERMYPDSYDGKLLLLKSFEQEEQLDDEEECYLFFDLSFIRYSTLIGLQKLHKPIQIFGVIGTQVAVVDESENYLLVGRRKHKQYYAPGLLTLPGGMLELADANDPKSSLLRELHEEVEIKIKNPIIIALLAEHTKYSIIFLIKATIDQIFDKDQIFKEKEDEFEGNKLYWIETNQLSKISSDKLMEGLTYLKGY